ncbi:MAG: hypothetical protein AAGF74_12925 [Pseudomonadota bacterium]
MRWILALAFLAVPATAQQFDREAIDGCLSGLGAESTGAECILPIRTYCVEAAGDLGEPAEIACLDRALLALTAWSDETVETTEGLAPMRAQVVDFRDQLTEHCRARQTGDTMEDRRDYRLCQLAGTGALYRNLLRAAPE